MMIWECQNCHKGMGNKRSRYCSSRCDVDSRHKTYIAKWRSGEIVCDSEQLSKHIRKYMLEKSGNKCGKCGWSKIHPITKKFPLTINHIDGNARNSVEENLEVICPNCHSLTPNYGILNRGNGRAARRIRARNSYNLGV